VAIQAGPQPSSSTSNPIERARTTQVKRYKDSLCTTALSIASSQIREAARRPASNRCSQMPAASRAMYAPGSGTGSTIAEASRLAEAHRLAADRFSPPTAKAALTRCGSKPKYGKQTKHATSVRHRGAKLFATRATEGSDGILDSTCEAISERARKRGQAGPGGPKPVRGTLHRASYLGVVAVRRTHRRLRLGLPAHSAVPRLRHSGAVRVEGLPQTTSQCRYPLSLGKLIRTPHQRPWHPVRAFFSHGEPSTS